MLATNHYRLFAYLSVLLFGLISWSSCRADSDVDQVILNKAWELIEHSDFIQAQALLKQVDPVSHRSELALYRGVIFSEQNNYRQSVESLSEIKPFFDQRHKEIHDKRIDLTVDRRAYEDELNYFRLYAYLGLSRTMLGQFNEDAEKDILNVMANLPMAEKATGRYVDAINFFAMTELALGKNERALGAFLQVYFTLNLADSLAKLEFTRDAEFNIACTYAHMGQVDETISWLKKSMFSNPDQRWISILADKDLDGIRNDEKFKEFIANKGR